MDRPRDWSSRMTWLESRNRSPGQPWAALVLFGLGLLIGLTPLGLGMVPGVQAGAESGHTITMQLALPEPSIPDTVVQEGAMVEEYLRRTEAAAYAERKLAREKRRSHLASLIAENYRIAPMAAQALVGMAQDAAVEYGVDPVLLLAIVAVESRFNPLAGSVVGATGLTQIMPEAHPEKIADVAAVGGTILDPDANLRLGARVLREYLDKFQGNQMLALQQYNGNLKDRTQRYARKVKAVEEVLREGLPQLPDGPDQLAGQDVGEAGLRAAL